MRHPSTEHVLQFFEAGHLAPGPVQNMAIGFQNFANDLISRADDSPELTVALRKLLEAKDAAVRSVVFDLKTGGEPPAANNPEPALLTPAQTMATMEEREPDYPL